MFGAKYADMRLQDTVSEEISVKNGNVEALSKSLSKGIGIRVIVDGAWGFASTNDLSPKALTSCVNSGVLQEPGTGHNSCAVSMLTAPGDVRPS